MALSESCDCCGDESETTFHVLRDYPQAHSLWWYFRANEVLANFFSLGLQDWLYNNLCTCATKRLVRTRSWSLPLVVGCCGDGVTKHYLRKASLVYPDQRLLWINWSRILNMSTKRCQELIAFSDSFILLAGWCLHKNGWNLIQMVP